MKQIKIFRNNGGAEVRLFKDSNTFVVRVKGPKPEPRVYRDSDGRVYGIERLPAPGSSTRITLNATNSSAAQYQAKTMLKTVKDVSTAPPPPLSEPTTTDISAWFLGGTKIETSPTMVQKFFGGFTPARPFHWLRGLENRAKSAGRAFKDHCRGRQRPWFWDPLVSRALVVVGQTWWSDLAPPRVVRLCRTPGRVRSIWCLQTTVSCPVDLCGECYDLFFEGPRFAQDCLKLVFYS
jgi:hypothetical protein